MNISLSGEKISVLAAACAAFGLMLTGCGNDPSATKEAPAQEASSESTKAAPEKEIEEEKEKESVPDETVIGSTTIRVLAHPGAHTEIMKYAAQIMAEKGVTVTVDSMYSDYFMPNFLVDSGNYDCNYFQHIDYLESFDQKQDLNLISLGGVHFEPLGIYPAVKKKLSDLADGDMIVIPADETNQSRALLLLEKAGVVTVQKNSGYITTADVEPADKKVKLEIVEAARIPEYLDDAALLIMNGDVARRALYTVTTDAIACEDAGDKGMERYVNVIAAKPEKAEDKSFQLLIEVLQSEEVRQFIDDNYAGSIVPMK